MSSASSVSSFLAGVSASVFEEQQQVLHPLSVYIPYVYTNVDAEMITRAFRDGNVGAVGRVDFVLKKDTKTGRDYHNAYVHFTEWFDNDYAKEVQQLILGEAQSPVKFYYTIPGKGRKPDRQFFWSLLKNTYVKKTADDFEEVATDADAPGLVPQVDDSLVSIDYVDRMEQQNGQYRMRVFAYQHQLDQHQLDDVSQQLAYYMQRCQTLEAEQEEARVQRAQLYIHEIDENS
jgi:hypothetical protein